MMRPPSTLETPDPRQPPRALLANEQMKLQQLMQKRGELQHTLTLVDQQIMKIRGAIEVLQEVCK